MLTRARFVGFKSLADVSVELSPLTVFVGPNASGKSSILTALHAVARVVSLQFVPDSSGNYQSVFSVFSGGLALERVLTRGQVPNLELSVDFEGGRLSLHGEWPPGEPVAFRAQRILSDEPEPPAQSLERFPSREVAESFRPLQARGLGRASLLAFDAREAARPHYSDTDDPHVELDGRGLAVVLQKLQGARDGRFEKIEAGLGAIVPSCKRLRTLPARVPRTETQRITIDGQNLTSQQERERTGARVEVEVQGAGWLPLDLLSEGTVLVLALLTVLHDESPRLVLLEDLDHALHPHAQGELVRQLRAFQTAHAEVQILCTTHSPYLIDHFTVEEVRVMRLDEHGHSHCRRLDEHPKWKDRQGFMEPGEFWSGVGEDWVR